MNLLLYILLDISAAGDESPRIAVGRKPLETLIADWVRRGEEINQLRATVAGQTSPGPQKNGSAPADDGH